MGRSFWLAAMLGLHACSPADSGNPGENDVAETVRRIGAEEGCAAALQVEPDRQSFAEWTDGVAGSSQDLTAFAARAGAAFKAAADDMCRAGRLDPARLAPFGRLLVQNGSGATETAVYSNPDATGKDALIFQWIFVEDGWSLPDEADIQQGIACWTEPDEPVCAERLP